MAARLTDKQKKKIVADYLECESYNATAKKTAFAGRPCAVLSKNLKDSLKISNEKKTKTPLILSLTWKASVESCVRYWEKGLKR